MKKLLSFVILFSALGFFGAGCASQTPTPTPVSPAEPPTSVTTPAPDTTPPPSTPPTTNTPSSTTSMQDQTPPAFPGVLPAAQVNKQIRIKTTMGDIVIQLMADEGPKAASNFIYLVKRGFYDGTIFHRVIPGFMIQGGDPTGTGRGGPGYQFANDPVKSTYQDGIVAMANAGRDTNGSQFFIMVANVPLSPDYSIFGKVVSGLDVAHKIADVARDASDRPNDEVKMISVTVEE